MRSWWVVELPADTLSPSKAYHLLTHVVAPRPIAWITSIGNGVVNAAPFSWFQAICADPPMIMVAIADRDGALKDTARNILDHASFVINVATGDQLQDVVDSSKDLPPEASEMEALGLAAAPSVAIDVPRIAGCAAHLECHLVESHRYGRDAATTVIIGEVVHAAIRDDLLGARGLLDATKAAVPARLGGTQYLRVDDTFDVRQS